MKKVLLLAIIVFFFITIKAQNLFPEKFNDCNLTEFCLDCGDTKGVYKGDLNQFFSQKFSPSKLRGVEGSVFVQILIDSSGHQCVLSIGNRTTGKFSKIELRKTINEMTAEK